MLRQKPVVRTLFKSLLRFTRRDELQPLHGLNLSPKLLGVDHLLPSAAANLKIQTVEDLQGAVYHVFRTAPDTPDNVSLGIAVLKALNTSGADWKEKYDAHMARYEPKLANLVQFRVGQVVQHRTLKYRGVVLGWYIDEKLNLQMLELLVDVLDSKEFMKFSKTKLSVPVESRMFVAVEDEDLLRVMNNDMDQYFEGFNASWRRYVPKPEIRMWYAPDFKIFEENCAGDDSLNNEHKELDVEQRQFVEAVERVGQNVSEIGLQMRTLLRSSSLYRPKDSTDEKNLNGSIIFHQVLEYLQEVIDMCANPDRYVTSPPGTERTGLSAYTEKEQGIDSSPYPLRRKLLRGGARRSAAAAMLHQPAFEGVNSDHSMFEHYYGHVHDKVLERTYYSLGYLANCSNVLDQLLTFRFQQRGLAYHDGLFLMNNRQEHAVSTANTLWQHPTAVVANYWNEVTTLPAIEFDVGEIVRHKQFGYRGVITGVDMRPGFNMSRWEGIVNLNHGQEQPIYRVTPDEGDVETFIGPGQFRNSYYVAQENLEHVEDLGERRIEHRSLGDIFLGYDVSTGRFRVPHKLRYCFPGPLHRTGEKAMDTGEGIMSATRVTGGSAVLPDYPVFEGSVSDSLSAYNSSIDALLPEAQMEDDTSIAQLEEKVMLEQANAYEEIDRIVVQLYTMLKASFAQTGSEYRFKVKNVEQQHTRGDNPMPVLSMDDMHLLLRHAATREHALYVESLVWMLSLCHHSPDINKLARLGISSAKRGNMKEAIEITNNIVGMDSDFAEPYNKLASYYFYQGQYEECLKMNDEVLKRFPKHFGSLAGAALSHEQLGNKEKAAELLREALQVHPWAAHLPTILISMMMEQQNLQEERDATPSLRSKRSEGNENSDACSDADEQV